MKVTMKVGETVVLFGTEWKVRSISSEDGIDKLVLFRVLYVGDAESLVVVADERPVNDAEEP